jgi:hypothetical protein
MSGAYLNICGAGGGGGASAEGGSELEFYENTACTYGFKNVDPIDRR